MKRTRWEENPDATYRKIALEIFSGDAYLSVNKKVLSTFGPEIAVYISNLVDKYKYFKQKNKLNGNDSFFLTHEVQSSQTGMTEHRLRRCKKTLKEMEVLQTEMKGSPAKEFYTINWQNLIRSLEDFRPTKFGGLDLRNSEGKPYEIQRAYKDNKYKDNKYKDNKYNNIIVEGSKEKKKDTSNLKKTTRSIKERNKEFIPLSDKLAKAVQSNKNINITQSKIYNWADEIRKLIETDEVSPQRVETVLDWYDVHIGGEYIPVVESGYSLRYKFIRLEEAMKRAGNNPAPNKPSAEVPSPKTLIKKRMGGLSSSFEKNCYNPARQIIRPESKEEKAELVKALLGCFDKINERWDKLPNSQKSLADLGPMTVLQRFIEWVGEQDWLTNKQPAIFTRDKVFDSFYGEYLKKIGGV